MGVPSWGVLLGADDHTDVLGHAPGPVGLKFPRPPALFRSL